ncbi:MAG TPA: HAD-IIA family hydrolase [Thermomicrobiales bacterium]|nr:HAD-IIA family hydrolase [Thermomicrobiales bacterium]
MSTDQTTIDESAEDAPLDRLQAAKGFIFDMDGVLYRGKTALPGVEDLFNALTLRDIPFLLATNNSMATPKSYVERMASMGVTVHEDDIQTSATATRDFLVDDEQTPDDAVILVVGMPPLAEQLSDGTSFRILGDDEPATDANVVVAGLDITFTYEKMKRAAEAIAHGARFVATNADDRLPIENGWQPGAGSILAGIERSTRVSPIVVGKPEPLMMLKGVERLGHKPEEVVMVGDRLDTDIAAAHRAGLMTALVLTGVATRADLASAEVLPDYVFADLPALLQGLVGHG